VPDANFLIDWANLKMSKATLTTRTLPGLTVVNPRTPGGRVARSMDINRNFMFNPEASRILMRQSNAS